MTPAPHRRPGKWADSAELRQCEMELLTPGRWEGEVFVEASWSRCPHRPMFVTGRGRGICEECVEWAGGMGAFSFPGGIRRYGAGGERPDDTVRLRVEVARSLLERLRQAAEAAGVPLSEWIRWALREGLRETTSSAGGAPG